MPSLTLRPYQLEPARAILESVFEGQGLTFSVEMSRQAGKNELSAQLEVLLLTLNMIEPRNLVKCSPTFKPQTINSMVRLRERLTDRGLGDLAHKELGYMIRLGRARAIFFSAEPTANVVGATAHILLEVDEAQDVDAAKYQKDFRPMGSTTNVTTVMYGTAWDDTDLLETTKQENLELERKDGIKRHFEYDWEVVARYNPAYRVFVDAERQKLGEDHPLFKTQFLLKTISDRSAFLNVTQRLQLRGDHECETEPQGGVYVAGVDVAGESEELEDERLRSAKPRKDSTVVTIARIDRQDRVTRETVADVVCHYWWTGIPHPQLYGRLRDLLGNVWKCKRICVDSTGVGEPVASFLSASLGSKVEGVKFTQSSKSEMAYGLLGAVNGGRIKMYAGHTPESQEFWWEAEHCKTIVRPNQTMGFYVDPSVGHDDFVCSLALVARASGVYRNRVATGRKG